MAQASAPSYKVVEGWEQLPPGYEHRDVAGVAVDSEDRVYLICRGDHPIIIYVSEVTWTFAVSRGLAPEGCHTFQKFALTP